MINHEDPLEVFVQAHNAMQSFAFLLCSHFSNLPRMFYLHFTVFSQSVLRSDIRLDGDSLLSYLVVHVMNPPTFHTFSNAIDAIAFV